MFSHAMTCTYRCFQIGSAIQELQRDFRFDDLDSSTPNGEAIFGSDGSSGGSGSASVDSLFAGSRSAAPPSALSLDWSSLDRPSYQVGMAPAGSSAASATPSTDTVTAAHSKLTMLGLFDGSPAAASKTGDGASPGGAPPVVSSNTLFKDDVNFSSRRDPSASDKPDVDISWKSQKVRKYSSRYLLSPNQSLI
jgi:hypothetical protein